MNIDTESLRTGIPLIDRQHEEYFRLLEQLLSRSEEGGAETGELSENTDALVAYAIEHFDSEEHLMRSAQYPYFEQHFAKHNVFREEVDGWAMLLASGKPAEDFLVRLTRWALEWFCDQVMTDDRKLAGFLKKRAGAKPA